MSRISPKNEEELTGLLERAFAAHESGALREAEKHYRVLISVLPQSWQLYYNLGLLLYEENRLEEALEVYESGIPLAGSNTDLLFNYAICQKELGLYEKALCSYDLVLAQDPDDSECHYNRAGCLMKLRRYEEAFSAYEQVLSRNPAHLQALNNQASVCQRLGKKARAINCYRNILALDPGHHAADHMLAALNGEMRGCAPDSYVSDVFDQFADHYEADLIEHLHYLLPERLFSFVTGENRPGMFSSLLDLGCGTGLLGVPFRTVTKHLHGVDLSLKMLGIARQKGIYDQLHHGEINGFLSSCRAGSYDLLVAADVFPYMGELDKTFAHAHRASSDTAMFCFSVEDLPGDTRPMQLRESGRFAHSHDYIRQCAARSGWHIFSFEHLNLRMEGADWIRGCLYRCEKTRTT